MRQSALEIAFKNLWFKERMETLPKEPGLLKLEEEVRFHPVRRWRFDFAHMETLVAVEIEGGTWTGGRHTRPVGYEKDCEKYNAAGALGWTVFRLTSRMIRKENLEPIRDLILARLKKKKKKTKEKT
jgi:very-short-patch-repair endonuclease